MKLKLFIILLVSAFSFSAFAEKVRKPQYDCIWNRSVTLKILFEYENDKDTTPDLVLQTKIWNKPEVNEKAVFSDPTVVQFDKLLIVLAKEEGTNKYASIRIEEATRLDEEGEPSGTYLRGLIDLSLDGDGAGTLLDTYCSLPAEPDSPEKPEK